MSVQFKDDHDRLRTLVDQYIALLSRPVRPELTEIMKGRTGFTGLFHSHFASESRAIEALRTGAPDSLVEKLLSEHGSRVREVVLRHSGLIQRWPIKRIEQEWQAYCREVRSQRDFYFTYLAWEEANIHPLLDQASERRRAS
ncbi:MAG: hypothetical protein J7485_09225 [Sphingobium sp.]|nr:hypothetical protein [Sphingobium sp.]